MSIHPLPLVTRLNYARFILELTQLTRRYGVAVKSVGGVRIVTDPGEFRDVFYVGDICSGDLLPCRPSDSDSR